MRMLVYTYLLGGSDMSRVNQTTIQKQGYNLNIIQTEKYKTNSIVLKMKAPLSKETVSYRALLPQVLQSSTENYPTTTSLRAHLEELYGAALYVNVSKKGEYHIMTFTLEIANEKFLSDSEPLLEKGIELLSEVLLQPHLHQDAFINKEVEQEKRALKQRIQSLNDDKMKYSSIRLVEEMCGDEPYGLEVNGSVELVEQITPDNLYAYYKHAIETDEVDLYIVGDVSEKQAEAICNKYLHLTARKPEQQPYRNIPARDEVKEVKEQQDVQQGKLNIGYRTGIIYGDDKYYALQVFNGIFGGFSHSKLFMQVREKNSLAYYVASRIESHKGLLMVMSGIQSENYAKTLTIIREQMDAMQKGDFSDEIIEQTKAVIENQLLETIDHPVGLVEVLYHNVVAPKKITIDEWINEVQKVKRDEIIAVANQVQLDTIYFLTGTEVPN